MLKALIAAASSEHLNLSFSVSRDHAARIVERPGLWMTDTELAMLSAELRTVASKTLAAGDLTYGVFSGERERFEHSIITVVSNRADKTPVAFNALAVMNIDLGHTTEDVLHLGLVMVDPNLRSKGLSWVLYGLTCVLILFRNGMRPLWLSNVTQVPSVVGLVSDGFARVFPVPEPTGQNRCSLMHRLLARAIMRDHRRVFGVGDDARFDEESFVIENAYTGGSDHLKKTFAEAPKHRNEAVNSFCKDRLDYDRGDDFLQIGQIDTPTALAYIKREVPPRSFTAFALAVIAAIVQRAALPVWQWADSSRDFGILRARSSKP
ncbi:MAG: hypothetical protein AAFV38_07275 [Pseudomonadota bacterium]